MFIAILSELYGIEDVDGGGQERGVDADPGEDDADDTYRGRDEQAKNDDEGMGAFKEKVKIIINFAQIQTIACAYLTVPWPNWMLEVNTFTSFLEFDLFDFSALKCAAAPTYLDSFMAAVFLPVIGVTVLRFASRLKEVQRISIFLIILRTYAPW